MKTKDKNTKGHTKTKIEGTATDITERKRAEEEARKFKTISDRAGYGVGIIDLEGNLIYVNESFAQMHGYTARELIGKHFSICHNEEQMKNVNRLKEQLAQKDSYVAEEVWHKTKEDTVFPTLMNGTLMRDEKGKPLFMAATAIDITERKRAEETLRQSEGKLSSMLQSIGDHISMLDKDLNIIWANETAKRTFGNDIIGKKCYEVFHKRKQPCQPYPCLTLKAFQDGKVHGHDTQVIDKDGNTIYFLCTANVALRDNEGKPTAVLEISRDITERMRVENALKKSELQYRTTIDSIDDPIHVVDADLRFIILNTAFKQWIEELGFETNVIGRTVFEVFTFLPDRVREEYRMVKDTGKILVTEDHNKVRGREIITETRKMPIFDGNKVVQIITIVKDITERRKMEAQLIQAERLSAVGTLAYGIAHEFNNILAGMLGNAEFGMGSDDPKEVKECFRIIMESCDKAKSIANSLLAFTRQRYAKKQSTNVTEVVETVLGLTERELEKQNIKVVRKFNSIPEITCDLGELSGVVLNMITNARDAMKPKGGTLTIEIGKKKDNMEMIFTDTGCGIPESIKSKIFEPFVTTKGALGQSEIPGTGLGLFLSYGIISRYHGTIDVKSEKDKESKFTIRIPISKNQISPDRVEPEEEKTVPQNLNILLVDDERAICNAIKRVFERKGHSVTTTLSGKKGLEIFKKGSFDLVLTDITMPDMDGLELISKLKKIDQQVKFIVLTGHITEDKFESAKKAGVHEVLVKPFRNEELHQAVGRAFST